MISSKICLVGAFAVGKTSLVRQFVESIFDEKYHTTIGVKIDKKRITIESQEVQLMIWDIEGVDIFTSLKPSYLRGSDGIIFVVDGTRPDTIKTIKDAISLVDESLTDYFSVLLLNKSDRIEDWRITEADLDSLGIEKQNILKTSAKTGFNVDEAFTHLAQNLIRKKDGTTKRKA